MNQSVRWMKRLALLAVGALVAPAALAQVPQTYCGTPPAPVTGAIPFVDITAQTGYRVLTGDMDYPDFSAGGNDGTECYQWECYSQSDETEFYGPYARAFELGTVGLPFPFGFSGIYYDGGSFTQPYQVNVWSNGLLTFDPSVSFDPTQFPLQTVPSDCQPEEENCNPEPCHYYLSRSDLVTTNVADDFGGFPFTLHFSPPNNPNALIAPWWGDLSLCSNTAQVGYLLTLDQNNAPMMVIQWTNATASPPQGAGSCPGNFNACEDTTGAELPPGTLPQFSFQVRLHQNSDVDFVYGPSANLDPGGNCFEQAFGNCSYISGIQSNMVFPGGSPPALMNYASQAISSCDGVTGCVQTQFPSGKSVTFHNVFRSLGPDLELVGINPPGQIPQGGTTPVPVTMSNGGGLDSNGGGQIQFYFSAGGTTPVGNPFSLQPVGSFRTCITASMTAQVTLPSQVPQGGGYLIAEYIPGPDSVDQTHSFAHASVIVGPQGADVAAVGPLTFSPAAIVGGQQISVSFNAQNVGQVDAPSVAYGVYVTIVGGSISANDYQIGGGVIADLAPGEAAQTISKTYAVPAALVSGEYLVGVILNPTGTLKEVNQTNNDAIGAKLLAVTSPGPVIVTSSLLDAQANSPYSVQLIAAGGDGKYQWSLTAGALPSGLVLTKAGLVSGQAQSPGTSQFEAKVTDGINQSTTASLSLTVDPFDQALTIVTPALPAGSTSQLYNFTIAAVGGIPPYQWTLLPGSGTPPAGVNLLSNGLLTGEPQFDGSTSFQVSVTDSTGKSVTSPVYTLTVFASGTLAVGSTVLPPAFLNQTYQTTLHYSGGTAPYVWQLLDVQREPNSPGDPGADLGPNLPNSGKPGASLLNWFPNQGEIEGVPSEVGVFAILLQVTDSEVPPATATGLVLLSVSASTNFSFTTVQLPQATINDYYSTQLLTTETDPDNVTCEALNTAQLPTDTAKLTLPPGLQLVSSCQILGVALEQGTFPFLVQANDTQGGIAAQSFTIQVASAPAAKSGGCQSAAGSPALAGLLLLALSGIRRRRRS